MADEDTNLETPGSPVAPPVESIETDELDQEEREDEIIAAAEDAGDAGDDDAPGELEDEDEAADVNADGKVSNDLYKAFKAITEVLLNFKIKGRGNEDYFPAGLFKRLPNKRLLPDYYEVIKEPSAISTLRGKIQRKQYTGVPEFVRDFALVVHNAQVYNRPNSQPVRDVLKLDETFRAELQKLIDQGLTTEEEIKYPDLGEIPYASPEPDPVSDEEDDEDEADEDEDDEVADDSDDDKRKRKARRGAKGSGKKGDEDDDEDKAGDAEQKRRGRPPKVATPMEHRIDRILKVMRKPKAADGSYMLGPFERLPDKSELPAYYDVIQNPMAYDILRKKAKRKKYSSVDEFMKDVELMFNNAIIFNEDGSDIHTWARELLQEARRAEMEEKAKPDTEYLQAAEGRIPLSHIDHKGDTWKVGDWIHVQNPNDITKPIVAQIYRTWKTVNDEEWINACWYYRPEQTVHQYEKHFYPNEVVKTGQYRDHKIDEVLNKCFVMFYTRYSRGRPRNLPTDTEVYVCEARYNEDKSKFNKIKTWASCLPDEVRDKDYEMDLFDAPRKIRKVPSPLLSRLKDDAKDSDEMPQPEWKHANAPPLVGGIHKRPRDENQSPPPEPTPPPQPPPAPAARTPSMSHGDGVRGPPYSQANMTNNQNQNPRPAPSMTPQPSFTSNQAQYSRQTSYQGAANSYATTTQNSQPAPQFQYGAQQTQSAPLAAAHPGHYIPTTPMVNYNRPAPSTVPPTQYTAQPVGNSAHQRTAETYVLSDAANASIPKHIRDQFPQDEQGRVLFFTAPPLDAHRMISESTEEGNDEQLQHTEKHMKALAVRKRRLDEQDASEDGVKHDGDFKQTPKQARIEKNASMVMQNADVLESGVKVLANSIKQATFDEYRAKYGKDWDEILAIDLKNSHDSTQAARIKDASAQIRKAAFAKAHLGKLNGQFAVNHQGYVTGWQKDFFTGTYLDDFDSRLP